jgi:lipopolysaccharide export system protein LptA
MAPIKMYIGSSVQQSVVLTDNVSVTADSTTVTADTTEITADSE